MVLSSVGTFIIRKNLLERDAYCTVDYQMGVGLKALRVVGIRYYCFHIGVQDSHLLYSQDEYF